jgi:hypothetical protein
VDRFEEILDDELCGECVNIIGDPNGSDAGSAGVFCDGRFFLLPGASVSLSEKTDAG